MTQCLLLRLTVLALVVFCFGVDHVAGQAGSTPPDVPPDYSSEAFVVEDGSTNVSFENDGTSVREKSFRVRIQSDIRLQRYGVLTLSYRGSAERVEIDYVRVRKPDGSVTPTSLNSKGVGVSRTLAQRGQGATGWGAAINTKLAQTQATLSTTSELYSQDRFGI